MSPRTRHIQGAHLVEPMYLHFVSSRDTLQASHIPAPWLPCLLPTMNFPCEFLTKTAIPTLGLGASILVMYGALGTWKVKVREGGVFYLCLR